MKVLNDDSGNASIEFPEEFAWRLTRRRGARLANIEAVTGATVSLSGKPCPHDATRRRVHLQGER